MCTQTAHQAVETISYVRLFQNFQALGVLFGSHTRAVLLIKESFYKCLWYVLVSCTALQKQKRYNDVNITEF